MPNESKLAIILNHLDFLIQQDTQNPPRLISESDGLFKYLSAHFSQYGFTVKITDLGDGHVIFYAQKGQPDILFNVHLDTVPVTASTIDSWQQQPFKLTIVGDKAYGRGSCDIKGAAACLMTLAQTADDLALVFTTDEEGANGCCVQSFIDHNDLSQYKQIIIAEPTSSQAVVSHRGYLSSQVEFKGVCGHSSMAIALAENAIHKSNIWLNHALDYAHTYVTKDNPAGICFNVGVIKGGEKNNMIAEHVLLNFSARVPAGQSSQQVFNDLSSLDEDKNSLWKASMMAPPLPADNQTETKSVTFCSRHNIKVASAVDFWTEAALFSKAGFPAIVLGPGDIKQAHTIDEWVELSQLEQSYQIYADVMRGY
ncbi:MAG: acetylornithine deacetylase [Alcanivoracaceae bacterium]|nr:acetylornithine deacetylase [Alcanivoracaceae bacterium]